MDGRGQGTEDRGQRTEDRGQKTEDRRQRTEVFEFGFFPLQFYPTSLKMYRRLAAVLPDDH
jgi:hypothetical protein